MLQQPAPETRHVRTFAQDALTRWARQCSLYTAVLPDDETSASNRSLIRTIIPASIESVLVAENGVQRAFALGLQR